MFDSPIGLCPLQRTMVLLDQTQRECAREHGCEDVERCPLEGCFTGYDFSRKPEQPAALKRPSRRKAAIA